MGRSILTRAIVYFLMALAFIYFAIQSNNETVWNPVTLILAAVAAMDIWVVCKLLKQYSIFKKKKK
ncbi:YdiK family protein [Oceanobacillus massiliensis]|uniref:YdiK family protein n=1 Tax=Oceanobacillus massiliensis TaxID=1465765 RepID=UPI003017AB7C